MQALRRRFLNEGQESRAPVAAGSRRPVQRRRSRRAVHQWIGTGGLLGYSAISRLAREVEALLLERPLDNASFANRSPTWPWPSTPRGRRATLPFRSAIVKALSGKRVALVGCPRTKRSASAWRWNAPRRTPVFFEAGRRFAQEAQFGTAIWW